MKYIALFISMVLCSSIGGAAQDAGQGIKPVLMVSAKYDGSENFVVGEVKGTVKPKAVYLPKPIYPDEARQAGVEGAVRVQVNIDSQGNVTDAVPVSGNKLLAIAAQDAARRSKFRMTRDASGQAVKADGVLVYSFEIKKAGWSQIASDLSLIERYPVSMISIAMISKAIDPKWTSELDLLEKLDEIRRSQPAVSRSPVLMAPPATSSDPGRRPIGMRSKSETMTVALRLPQPASAEQTVLAQNLIRALQARLAGDELSAWQFDLGLNLYRALQFHRDPDPRIDAADIVKRFIDNRPTGVSAEVLAALQTLAATLGQEKRTMETSNAISRSIMTIFRAK